MKQKITIHLDNTFKTLSEQHNLFGISCSFNAVFFELLLNISFVHCRSFDNNSFSGILDMDTLDKEYAFHVSNLLISMVNNNISGFMPNNATYSPVL
jgi:hypothetical protein